MFVCVCVIRPRTVSQKPIISLITYCADSCTANNYHIYCVRLRLVSSINICDAQAEQIIISACFLVSLFLI